MQINKKSHNNFTWTNLTNQNLNSVSEEEKIEMEKFFNENNINSKWREDIMYPSLRAKAEHDSTSIYLSLHFPQKINDKLSHVEIDFIIRENSIISITYQELDVLNKFIENINNFNIKSKLSGSENGGAYFAYFLRDMYKNMNTDLDDITKSITKIENSIFSGDERETIENISLVRKKLFDFDSSIRFHGEVLESYNLNAINLFGLDYKSYSDMISSGYLRTLHTISHQKELLLDLKDTNDFLLNHKTNQMIKSFTALSFIILPLTLISGFFGMNTIFPEGLVKDPFGTIYLACGMLSISVIVLLYLYIKKWL